MASRRKSIPVPNQPDTNQQSGSVGRTTDPNTLEQGKDTGQDRYGQSGFAGKQSPETIGQTAYRRSGPDGGQRNPDSNEGSGRAAHEAEEYRHETRVRKKRGAPN